jgi:arylsulfatase A-like enzyme
MGDDIGWFNIGASHQGMMSGKTPNLDTILVEGMRFTDDYAEASGIAGLRRQTQPRGGVQ